MNIKLLLLVVTFGLFTGLAIQSSVPASAANVTYRSFFQNGSCSATGNPGTSATIPDSRLSDFNNGRGVTIAGGRTIYLSSQIYSCCYEQMLSYDGTTPGGCANYERPPSVGNRDPWFVSRGGDYYARFGMPNRGQSSNITQFSSAAGRSLSQFLYSSGQSPSDRTRLSRHNMLLLDYDSSATSPPALSGFAGWYEYLERLVQTNSSMESRNISQISGNVSTALSTSGSKGVYQVNGNLRVVSGAICNTGAMIFVPGDLTIEPQFRLQSETNPDQGCMFVVRGDVTISPTGSGATRETLGSGGNSASYDIVHAAIISNGEVIVTHDGTDGLRLYGLLTAAGADFQRDTSNSNFPSVIIDYDPRYTEIFKDELKQIRFSTREKGFVDR